MLRTPKGRRRVAHRVITRLQPGTHPDTLGVGAFFRRGAISPIGVISRRRDQPAGKTDFRDRL